MRKTIHAAFALVLSIYVLFASVPAVRGGDGNDGSQFFSLAGQAGLPKYLKCDLKALADEEGIRGGEVRTVDTDYFKKDFVLDLIVQFKADDKSSALIGIGENGREGGWLLNTIACVIWAPSERWRGGTASFWLHRNGEQQTIGAFKTAGPHLFRFAKKGNALSTAICANYKGGEVKPDFTKTLPDFATATPWFNRLNSGLFFGGEATFKAVRLEVDGKPVSPGEPTGKKAAAIDGTENLFKLSSLKQLPDFLQSNQNPVINETGLSLNGKMVRTKATDLVDKDFTLDVVFRFQPNERGALEIGIGENGRDGGWILNTLMATVYGPEMGAHVTLATHRNSDRMEVGKFGRDHLGPNLLRVQKHGDALSFALCVDFKDKFTADYVKTYPNIRCVAPYLTKLNSNLFIAGWGANGTVEQVRLVVDGKPMK